MGTFPNPETQIGKPRGPKPGCQPGKPAIGKRRAKTLQYAAKKAALIVGEVVREFQGDSLALLQQVYKDQSLPIEMRLAAARIAAPFENATLAPTEGRTKATTLEQLVAQATQPSEVDATRLLSSIARLADKA